MTERKKKRLSIMQDSPLKIFSLRLTNWHLRRAKKLGDGNVSEGVRIALESDTKDKKEN